MSRRLTIGLVLALATATACASDDDTSTTTEPTPVEDAGFSDADIAFAQNMIPHHAQAIDMAEIALDPDREAGPAVTDLATRVRDAQDPEIDLMREWLAAWGMPMSDREMDEMRDMDHSGMDHAGMDHSGMDGMMTADEMNALRSARGPDFDRLWMELMIRHHEGAITMAEALIAEGVNDDALRLAAEIVAAQEAEIDEMSALLDE